MIGWMLAAAIAAEPVAFDRLDAQRVEDWVVVSYVVDDDTWDAFEGHLPPMQVTLADASGPITGTLSYTVALSGRGERLALPAPRAWRVGRVTLAIGGHPLRVDRLEGPEVVLGVGTLRAHEPRPAFPDNRAAVRVPHPDIVLASGRATCPDPDWALIGAACGDVVIGSSAGETCSAAAAAACFDPVPVIRACDAHTHSSSDVIACIERSTAFSYEPSAVIHACGAAVTGGDALVQCVQSASRLDTRAARAVRACGEASVGSSAVMACLDGTR